MSRALFPELDLELPDDRPKPGKRPSYFAAVALEQSIDKELDYEVPAAMWDEVKIGQRVRVPLGRGNKLAHGYIVGLHREQRYPKTKPIRTITDPRPLVDGQLLELARWIGRYYVCPIGTVIDSILPSAVKKRVGIGYVTMCRLAMTRDAVQDLLENTKAPKRRALLGRLLQVEEGGEIELAKLAGEAGVKPPTVRRLSKLGVITLRNVADLPALSVPKNWSGPRQQPLTLSDEQRVVMDNLTPRLVDGFSVNLLHGVTGSGKTEVYLQAIAKVVEAGKQAIVLVPEIALTPQTVRRFTGRFEKVAVLHSGLTAGARHRFWQQIAAGQADVVVGARSAIFAPVPKLGIVVVDEEHENSYKQDQAPRYHARDVAIKRAQMAECAVVLGSATPSLESWERAKSGHLLSLPSRVADRPMPAIEIIDLRNVQRQTRRIELLSPRLEHLLRVTKEAGEQGILLLNRRGYANFVFCPSCLEPVNCRFCDATMTYHRNVGEGPGSGSFEAGKHTGQLHCHYCLAVNPLPPSCEACGHKLSLFGLGTQRVEEEIRRKLPDLRFERVDSDTMRGGSQYEQVLDRFSRGELDVLLGTQMIAKGLDYPNVTFVGIVSGDTALSLPDFRASERTFQLITQVAGRAGRGEKPGRVALQTFMPDDPTIRSALAGDYERFADRELELRRQTGQPPFARMARIVVRDQDEKKLASRCQQLVVDLGPAVASENSVTLRGPHPCAISRISGYWRQQVLLSAPSALPLQRVLSRARSAGNFATNDRLAVDVDPVSLL
ncbi:MAG: primosomal protein N' [Planctomycetota bacterium]